MRLMYQKPERRTLEFKLVRATRAIPPRQSALRHYDDSVLTVKNTNLMYIFKIVAREIPH